jgi:hypothetical protein
MGHLPTTRLMDLGQENAILEPEEMAHLQDCEECDQLLRIFVRQFSLTRKMLHDDDAPASRKKAAS